MPPIENHSSQFLGNPHYNAICNLFVYRKLCMHPSSMNEQNVRQVQRERKSERENQQKKRKQKEKKKNIYNTFFFKLKQI